jgi:16S rRNA (cytosine1402-N4)-methyltransferase
MNALNPHLPVLIDEIYAALEPMPGKTIIDATFGAGGYSKELLKAGANVIAFDRDPTTLTRARCFASKFENFTFVQDCFAQMTAHVTSPVDGIVFDIGVSSMQLDRPERGFSFMNDGPLDMRMSQAGMSAADFLNSADEEEIANVIYTYGEEHASRAIARAIVAARPLHTTKQLADVVRKTLGRSPKEKKDPATRTFQALRIFINQELEELENGLMAAESLLKPKGVLAVVSFHSLEDRIVKHFLRESSQAEAQQSRHLPQTPAHGVCTFMKPLKPIKPSTLEVITNQRARSATLRVGIRTQAQRLKVK